MRVASQKMCLDVVYVCDLWSHSELTVIMTNKQCNPNRRDQTKGEQPYLAEQTVKFRSPKDFQ